MSFKAAICVLNSKYIHRAVAPWCLYTACKKHCNSDVEVGVIEGTVNENFDVLLSRITADAPDAISFSCYIWNINYTLSLCSKIKELFPNTKIILGGPEVGFIPQKILTVYPFVDFVISGEGENSFPSLLNKLQSCIDEDISGISYKNDHGITTSTATALNLDDIETPFCREYLETLSGRIAYIESSRGCPFSCAFCLSGAFPGVRYFPMQKVKNEIISLCKAGAKTVKFVDRTFNCNKSRAAEILSFISENYGKDIPADVCFHFEIAADILDNEILSLIENMPLGSVQFEIGIQSFNEDTLKKIGRKTNLEKLEINTKKLISFSNCHIHIDLIAGLPLEDYNSFKNGFNRAYKIGANMLQLGFLKLLFGSRMYENSDEFLAEYSDEPPYEVMSTPYISAAELRLLHKAENELERLYNSGRFKRTLEYIFSVCDITPYDLFLRFGEHLESIGEVGSIPLDKYICLAFEWFSCLEGTDKSVLRDMMLIDRISTNSSDVIPSCLKIYDLSLSKTKALLKKEYGADISVGLLYSMDKIILCDYKKKNPVTGIYDVKYFDIKKLSE